MIVPDVIFEKRKRTDAVLITDDTPIQHSHPAKELKISSLGKRPSQPQHSLAADFDVTYKRQKLNNTILATPTFARTIVPKDSKVNIILKDIKPAPDAVRLSKNNASFLPKTVSYK
jgi:hypothetical protein